MLKKTIVALLVAGSVGNAYAACPASIDGGWAGSLTRVVNVMKSKKFDLKKLQRWFGDFSVASVTISGSGTQATITQSYSANGFTPVTPSGPRSPMSMTYNPTTCEVIVDGSIYGFVSNGGTTMQLVESSTEDHTYTSFTLYKQ